MSENSVLSSDCPAARQTLARTVAVEPVSNAPLFLQIGKTVTADGAFLTTDALDRDDREPFAHFWGATRIARGLPREVDDCLSEIDVYGSNEGDCHRAALCINACRQIETYVLELASQPGNHLQMLLLLGETGVKALVDNWDDDSTDAGPGLYNVCASIYGTPLLKGVVDPQTDREIVDSGIDALEALIVQEEAKRA